MSSAARFRLTTSTIALFREEGRHVARTVPSGAVISTTNGIAVKGLVEVIWDGRAILMFAQDIRARGEELLEAEEGEGEARLS